MNGRQILLACVLAYTRALELATNESVRAFLERRVAGLTG